MAPHLNHVLATAISLALHRGDERSAKQLAELTHTMSGATAFAEGAAPGTRGRGMLGKLADWLTGRSDKAATKGHTAEHARQAAAFEPGEEIPQAEALSHNEQVIVDGNIIHMASSNVEAIAWRYQDRALYVQFKGKGNKPGDVYKYEGVPLSVAVAMVETASAGRFVWGYLREGTPPYKSKYNGRKVGAIPTTSNKPSVVRRID
jgi:hypothetical protein